MKQLFIWGAITALLFAVGCNDDDIVNQEEQGPKQPSITLDSSISNFTTEGGTNTISFTATTAWTAEVINSRADTWCSISPTSGSAGNATITITTTPNDTTDDRFASINIKAGAVTKTITVSQKQKDALTLSSSKFEVAAEGGEVVIEVKANIDFDYVIDETSKSWISYDGTRTMKTSYLVFKVAENEDKEKREATITITSGALSEKLTIYQDGLTPSIIISKNEYIITSSGETISVEVKSNIDVSVELPDEVDWITENTTRALSTNTYRFDIAENTDYDQRSAEIIFANKENNLSDVVRIIQSQKDAIVLAKDEYEFDIEGGELDFEIQTNVDVSITISDDAKDWILQTTSRALETKKLSFNITANPGTENRFGAIILEGGGAKQMVTIKQVGLLERERNALIAIYNALDGDNWIQNAHWCSDKPVRSWANVGINSQGSVIRITLNNNNLRGELPPEIGDLTELERLSLKSNAAGNSRGNYISGQLPKEIFDLKKLSYLDLQGNQFSGIIPSEIGNLTNLTSLDLSRNAFTGSIPECIMQLPKLKELYLCYNKLSGTLPESFYYWDFWRNWWGYSIRGNNYKFEDINLPGPSGIINTSHGRINLDEEYSTNKYTILFQMNPSDLYNKSGISVIIPTLKEIHNKYSQLETGQRINIISFFASDWITNGFDFIKNEELPWANFTYEGYGLNGYPIDVFSTITVVDNSGKIVFSDEFTTDRFKLYFGYDQYFANLLDSDFRGGSNLYVSTDFSQDGKVVTLQKATIGNGINVVLMGDAYSDRLITDGTYANDMMFIYNHLFTEEPYKSFKEYFNVYYVTAVSKNEGYGSFNETAFSGYFAGGTLVIGNDTKVFNYAQKAISKEEMDEALLVVAMNSDIYAGTCTMYHPETTLGYGNGVAIAYIPKCEDSTTFKQVIHHEACGHGFAKLADEYAYEYMGVIPGNVATTHQEQQMNWGWWKNIDFTSDLTTIRWNHFINDTRYADEELGAYEGGLTYFSGVWRPTENSIMRHNTEGFNAPSREAIYYRIHKLAYGDSWEYDYEEFVKWDIPNRRKSVAPRTITHKPTTHKPTHPPVIKNKSWRNAEQ